jgi:hypothetical protein
MPGVIAAVGSGLVILTTYVLTSPAQILTSEHNQNGFLTPTRRPWYNLVNLYAFCVEEEVYIWIILYLPFAKLWLNEKFVDITEENRVSDLQVLMHNDQ